MADPTCLVCHRRQPTKTIINVIDIQGQFHGWLIEEVLSLFRLYCMYYKVYKSISAKFLQHIPVLYVQYQHNQTSPPVMPITTGLVQLRQQCVGGDVASVQALSWTSSMIRWAFGLVKVPIFIWLVVLTHLKHITQLVWLFPIYGNIKSMFQTTN